MPPKPKGPDRDKDAKPFEQNADGEWIIPGGDENHHHCRVEFPDANGGFRLCTFNHYFSSYATLYEHMKYVDCQKVATRRGTKATAGAPRKRAPTAASTNVAPLQPNHSLPQENMIAIKNERQHPVPQHSHDLGMFHGTYSRHLRNETEYNPVLPNEAGRRLMGDDAAYEDLVNEVRWPLMQPQAYNSNAFGQHQQKYGSRQIGNFGTTAFGARMYNEASMRQQQPSYGMTPAQPANFGPPAHTPQMYMQPSTPQHQQYGMRHGEHDEFAAHGLLDMHGHAPYPQQYQPHGMYTNQLTTRPVPYAALQPQEQIHDNYRMKYSGYVHRCNAPPPTALPNPFRSGQHHAASYMNPTPLSQHPNYGAGQTLHNLNLSPYLQPNFGGGYQRSPSMHEKPGFTPRPHTEQHLHTERNPEELRNPRQQQSFGMGQGIAYQAPSSQPNFILYPKPQQQPMSLRNPEQLIEQRRKKKAAARARARAIAGPIKREIEDDDELMEIDEETFEGR